MFSIFNFIFITRNLNQLKGLKSPFSNSKTQLFDKLLNLGIQCVRCGEKAIRLRPSLTFNEKHAEILFDRLATVLKSFFIYFLSRIKSIH